MMFFFCLGCGTNTSWQNDVKRIYRIDVIKRLGEPTAITQNQKGAFVLYYPEYKLTELMKMASENGYSEWRYFTEKHTYSVGNGISVSGDIANKIKYTTYENKGYTAMLFINFEKCSATFIAYEK